MTASSLLRIVEVDPHDVAAFDAWHAVYLAAETHGLAGLASPWQLEELRVAAQSNGQRGWSASYSGHLADDPTGPPVCVGWVRTPLQDNLDRAEIGVHTHPDHRRRGHGRAMLAHVERIARERGRTVLYAEATWPEAGGAAGEGQPGPEFARATGFHLALGDVKRELRLPVDPAVLDELAAEAAPHHTAYTLRSWVGPVPEELLESWARLNASLMTEAPTGDLHVEPESADPALVREAEETAARQGRTKLNTVALDAAGEVVAYTDLATTVHEPDRAYQWGTLVRRADRGHRLGLAVKVANLRLLQEIRPGVERLITYNAEVNAPMVAVNERLGFRPVARLGEFQRRLGPAGADVG
ncbi:GNAT family N-acetyltransferase [Nocardioides ferulae]|uniref:GNAT family N-acetyltransferase n=1 Tax=Nocardioides ferulae TaxID=2340821 RepID=UPI000EAEDC82|nr:GNAT family N-acetyltransferase [Nocardioides ferulae]